MSGSAVRGCCLPKRMMSRLRLKQSPAFSSSRWLSSSFWPGFPSQPLTMDSETAIFVTSPSRLKKRLFSLPRGANNLKLLELSKSQPSNISFTAVGLLWVGRRAACGIPKHIQVTVLRWDSGYNGYNKMKLGNGDLTVYCLSYASACHGTAPSGFYSRDCTWHGRIGSVISWLSTSILVIVYLSLLIKFNFELFTLAINGVFLTKITSWLFSSYWSFGI